MTEDRIQYEIVSWFTNTYCLKMHEKRCMIFSVPNDTTDIRELMRKKSTGLMAGVSDLVVILPEKVLFFEVKMGKNSQSEKQREFEQRISALGFKYFVVRSLDEFKSIVLSEIRHI